MSAHFSISRLCASLVTMPYSYAAVSPWVCPLADWVFTSALATRRPLTVVVPAIVTFPPVMVILARGQDGDAAARVESYPLPVGALHGQPVGCRW